MDEWKVCIFQDLTFIFDQWKLKKNIKMFSAIFDITIFILILNNAMVFIVINFHLKYSILNSSGKEEILGEKMEYSILQVGSPFLFWVKPTTSYHCVPAWSTYFVYSIYRCCSYMFRFFLFDQPVNSLLHRSWDALSLTHGIASNRSSNILKIKSNMDIDKLLWSQSHIFLWLHDVWKRKKSSPSNL